MTNQEMISEMLDRAQAQVEQLTSTGEVIEALDRDGDFDLHDQMVTWETLVGSMTELLGRMRKING
jgi:CheY-like chemotaxis protein